MQTLEFGVVDKNCVYMRITFSRFLAYEYLLVVNIEFAREQYEVLSKWERSIQFNQPDRVIHFTIDFGIYFKIRGHFNWFLQWHNGMILGLGTGRPGDRNHSRLAK